MKRTIGIASIATGAALLAGCSTGAPAPSETVVMTADYPSYDLAGLADEAAVVVEGVVTGVEDMIMYPTFEGDTAEENPGLGLSDEEQAQAIEDGGVAATEVTFEVTAVHSGDVSVGDSITFVQTGGVADGVTYIDSSSLVVDIDNSYLVFLTGEEGSYYPVGGGAGVYESTGDGTFVATSDELAPEPELSEEDVADVTG